MASIDKYLEDPEFANWVKSGLALNITNEVLRPFVVKEITKLHQSIVKTLPRGVSCTGCSVDTACPKGICDEIQREIENKHWYPNPSFTNTCTGRWSADPWEIAKCYMPPLQGYKRSAASDADFSACINVIINCKHFQAFGTSDPRGKETDLSKSRDFRNLVMHGSSQKVTENDMKENLDILINILNMIKTPETEADTKEAREKIEMTKQLKIKFEDAIEVTKNAIEANADNLDKDEDQVQRERLLVNFEAGCRKALCRLTEEHISIQEGNLSVAAFLSKIGIFAERKDLCSRHQNMLFPKTGTHAAIREWDLFVYCFILEELDLYEPIGNAVSIFVREVKKIRNRIVIDASGVTQDDLSELCDYLIDTDLNTDITEIFNKDSPDVDVICSFNILGSWWREEEDYGKKPISKKQLNIKKQIMQDVDKRLSENKDTIKREILEMLGYRGEHVTLQGDNAAVLDTACEVRVSGCDEETANATQEHITFPDNNDIERNEAIDHFRQQRNLLKVTPEKGSIILNVKCSSITNVLDFWDSCIDGRAVEALSKVRDYYRRYFKCDTLKFDVILTKKVVSRCVNEIVKGLPSHFERLIVEVTDEVRGILADKEKRKMRKRIENEKSVPPLPIAERCVYFIVTVLTVAYICYSVLRDSFKYDGVLNLYDFKPGWWILGGQEQDISNFEWHFWYGMFWKIVPWYLGHFAVGRLVYLHCSTHRKSIFFVYSGISVSVLVGWRPACLFVVHSATLFIVSWFARPPVVWMTSLGLLSTLNFEPFISQMKQLVEDDEEENWYYLFMFTLALNNIRATSFCLEKCAELQNKKPAAKQESLNTDSLYTEKPKLDPKAPLRDGDFEYDLMDLMCYTFYLPLFFTGPILTYNLFKEQINMPVPEFTMVRFKTLGVNILRFVFWAFFNEFILHFVYFNALQHNLTVLRSVSLFTLAGIGYSHGQFFMVKYHVMFGLPASIARLDNLDPPQGPKCISYIYLYSDMWKYFDRGLYSFLKRYIYVPCGGSQAGIHMQILGSVLCFMYIFYWHGAEYYILWWILLNYIGVSLEKVGDLIVNISAVKYVESHVLSRAGVQRVHAFCSIPIFLLSCFSMFCFFGGQTVGYIFFQRLVLEGWLGSWITLMFLVYAAIQNAIEINRWLESRIGKKQR